MLNYRILNFFTRTRKTSNYTLKLMNSQNCHLCLKTENKLETKIDQTEPIPKSILYIISRKVKARLKKDMELKYISNYSDSVWHSSLSFTWPFHVQTSGTATSKREAENLASAAAVNILKQKDIINEDGHLKLLNKILQYEKDTYLGSSNEETEPADYYTIEDLKDNFFSKAGQQSQNAVSSAELEMIFRRFPQPTSTLNNVYADVSNQLQNSKYRLIPTHYLKSSIWHCMCKVQWPEENTFSAKARTKAQATKMVALRILHWLTSIGHLTREGYPRITHTLELPPPYKATWPTELSDQLDTILQHYKTIEHVINESNSNKPLSSVGDFEENEGLIYSFHSKSKNQDDNDNRNGELLRKYINRNRESPNLPINDFRDKLLNLLQNNKAVVVKGEPGCGKSTQVPQFIMDSWTEMGQGAECNMIISQPRRISAISIAKRVAYERGEMLGDVVGYHVRLDSQLPRSSGGSLLYATSGILLKYMQTNPTLNGVSHIILDEAHERSTDIDMLMVLLRRALNSNQELKLIVMSATVDAGMFQKYFGASILEVPGFTYPVKQYFLEDLYDEGLRMNFDSTKSHLARIDANQVAEVIKWVHVNRPEGAILCFLPGWSEIQAVRNRLNEMLDSNMVQIIPAHSRLSHYEQGLIFRNPPSGIRKIILATNIAETSITINDVLYVVDTGVLKEQRLDVHSGISTMGNHWASQTNIKQRKGRAGRVKPGESFHIFQRERYKNMDVFPTPEILRVPLVKTVLDCKVFSEKERAANFLAEMPNSPTAQAIDQAINELIEIGALDKEENLTPLGKRISYFTTHPKLSKALVNACILGCVKPVLTITSILSGEVELFLSGLTEKENIRNTKHTYHPTSDHIALSNIHSEAQSRESKDFKTFCSTLSLNMSNINLVSKLNYLFADSLKKCQILDETEEVNDELAPCNKNFCDDEFIKCALLSGSGNLLIQRSWDIQNGRLIKNKNIRVSESGHYVTLTSESVNHKLEKLSTPFFTYFHKINSLERQGVIVRESSHVSPLSVLLFKNGILDVCETTISARENGTDIKDDNVLLQFRGEKEAQMLCDKRSASKITHLRDVVWSTLNFFIRNKGVTKCEEYESVLNFQTELHSFLRKALNHSARKIGG